MIQADTRERETKLKRALKASKEKAHNHWVMSVAFSPDGKTIVSGSWDKTIKVWGFEKNTLSAQPLFETSGEHALMREDRSLLVVRYTDEVALLEAVLFG